MPAEDVPALEVRGLVKHYPVRGPGRCGPAVKALDGVDLTLRPGTTLGLVGESGCGKSTLARLLMALERPTSGSVLVEGRDLFSLPRAELRRMRRDIQLVMQDPFGSLDPRMTVGQIIAEPFEIHRDLVPKAKREHRVRELLDMVGLDPRSVHRHPHEFSGGQRQRIGIARALALRPRVVICDEPVSALDVSIQAQVVNLLADLQREFGLAYVFIAHNLAVVRHVADEIAVMYLGRIVERGSAETVYGHPAHPYTRALLAAAPVPDPRRRGHEGLPLLDGDPPNPADPPAGCAFAGRCWKSEAVCSETRPVLAAAGAGRSEGGAGRQEAACHFPEA
ncbi:ABC transporter ATP-binding protein [Streptomyces sp. NPDC020681]|uniref:ABC transporter ATP-binding protein n=1 Tax=Streptomyces sp. NPDC020681 TaxID=3365083 RepID=UPI0037931CC2